MITDKSNHIAAEEAFRRAVAEAAKGNMQNAAQSLRETIAHAPFHREANAHLAWLLSQHGHYRAALPAYFRLIVCRPFSLQVYLRTAQCLYFYLRSFTNRLARKTQVLTGYSNVQRRVLKWIGYWLAWGMEHCFRKSHIVSQWVRHHGTVQRLAGINDFEYYKIAEMRFTFECLNDPNLIILDLGSGRSGLPSFLVRQSHTVVSAELDRFGLSVQNRLESRLQTTRLLTAAADFLSLPFRDNVFDVITLISTIEHVPGDGDMRTIRQLSRYLKPGGVLLVTVPANAQASERWTEHTIGHVYGEAKTQEGLSGFLREYDPVTIHDRLIGPSGMTLQRLNYYGETSQWGWLGWGRNWIDDDGTIHPSLFSAPLSLWFTREIIEEDLARAHWAVACICLRKEEKTL